MGSRVIEASVLVEIAGPLLEASYAEGSERPRYYQHMSECIVRKNVILWGCRSKSGWQHEMR